MPRSFQLKAYMHEGLVEAGCDEAGRGPLAGPVFAAAVILPEGFFHPLLDDSKRMTERSRDILRPIIEQNAVAWAVEAVQPEEIDRINIAHVTVVHGDATYASIAAASVLAKTWRDEYMRKIAQEYPQYGWDRNMGYPTKEHIEAIREYGYTPYHRKSFHPKELEPTLFDNI